MHEFSLAQNIVEIVTDSTLNAGKTKVTKVFLEIGEIAGVEESALIAALESIIPQTILSETIIEIKTIDGRAICQECKTTFQIHDLYSVCPCCNSYSKEIISGKEFTVKSIEAE